MRASVLQHPSTVQQQNVGRQSQSPQMDSKVPPNCSKESKSRQEGKADQGEIPRGSDFLKNPKQSPNPFSPSRVTEQLMWLTCKEETVPKTQGQARMEV